jgi:hypothetical protein
MSHLIPCPECNRHVRQTEPNCPFCAAKLALANTPPPPMPATFIGRAALFTFSATLAGATALSACSGDSESSGDDGGGGMSGTSSGSTNGGSPNGGSPNGGNPNGGNPNGGTVTGGMAGFNGSIGGAYGAPPTFGGAGGYTFGGTAGNMSESGGGTAGLGGLGGDGGAAGGGSGGDAGNNGNGGGQGGAGGAAAGFQAMYGTPPPAGNGGSG